MVDLGRLKFQMSVALTIWTQLGKIVHIVTVLGLVQYNKKKLHKLNMVLEYALKEITNMADAYIGFKVDEGVKERLLEIAKENKRSMSGELRVIVEGAVNKACQR